ncbi:hypothetical protein [Candidatus Allofournierella merdipullorum]|uniref:hypothetical protein n=1 Tax=Candidatus Allofournierella merdipullorum TaxID=2838595 RepID=UPI002A893397|nr:hypothetical protein [Candidatus Fournierella merdipullorum]
MDIERLGPAAREQVLKELARRERLAKAECRRQRAAHYTPDFVIEYVNGTVEAVEVKSHFTRTAQRDYIYRRRLFIELIARPRGWVFTEYIEKEQ